MDTPPVAARPAATVALLRDGAEGLEVFLQRRVAGMAFAPDVTVFPGGRVDPGDVVDWAAGQWPGPGLDWWAQRLGAAPERAGALVIAAIRETFEESGVLLAGSDAAGVLTDPDELRRCRALLTSGQRTFPEMLRAASLVPRADLLAPWARWITPESEVRRYDTWFFLAAMPAGQRADGETAEVAEAAWRTTRTALADWRADRLQLYPPTWVTLEQLAELPDVAAALAAAGHRKIEPIMPTLRRDAGRPVVVLPDTTQ